MPTAKSDTPRIGVLNCLTERDDETGLYVSHCLNFDLMECGATADAAWKNLKAAVKQYIEYCYGSYPDGLSKSAGREEWQRFADVLKSCGTVTRVEELEIVLRPSQSASEYPVWMQGVDTDGTDCSRLQ